MLASPPLSLYIHIPWCVQKCPYCDFNSHALKHDIPETEYVEALLSDLDNDIAAYHVDRPLHSIFIGGGTPSLFSGKALKRLLDGVKQRLECPVDMEVTLEANPGTVEADKFKLFSQAGVTRLSIGVQSFANPQLIQLGRIHDDGQAERAALLAQNSGVKSFNLDLMHGLPKQNLTEALDDLKRAISLKPNHISWYQLTIEPNTSFYSKPPQLPEDDVLWEIQEKGAKLLADAGYNQYEISAYARDGFECEHNKNYWRFGDYLGIGCGAHGKITVPNTGTIIRTVKVKHPKGFLDADRPFLDQENRVSQDDLPFEYMMNQLRLKEPFTATQFEQRTGLTYESILPKLDRGLQQGLLTCSGSHWQVTERGHRYLNTLLELFL